MLRKSTKTKNEKKILNRKNRSTENNWRNIEIVSKKNIELKLLF